MPAAIHVATEARCSREEHSGPGRNGVCLTLTHAIGRARSVEAIYDIALETLADALNAPRSAILLFDADSRMLFVAARGLSHGYQKAVEGHTPWAPDSVDANPIVVGDIEAEPSLAPLLTTLRTERIAALTFVPLVSDSRVIGKFMLYFNQPRTLNAAVLELAELIAAQVAVAVVRTRAEESARRSEEQLRFALDAAGMGTWAWEFQTGAVRWSDTLERLHGLPTGGFDGTFDAYQREIHPDDRDRVLSSLRRSVDAGLPHEVEYRIVGRDGQTRWVQGKGRVEYAAGVPVRMTGVCRCHHPQAGRARPSGCRARGRAHERRVPGHAVARAAHAAWRHHRVDPGTGSRWAVARQGVAGHRDHRPERPPAGEADRRHPRRVADHHRQAGDRAGPLLPSQLVDNAVTAIAPEARARRIELTRDVPAGLPPIDGDLRRLEQVLGNLLSNAVKFTPDGGAVHVGCAADDAEVTIEVRDSGIGIATEFLPHMFDRFRQGDSRTTRRHGGLGLGLAVARHMIERHGGTIAAHSDGEGHGTTMTVRLPVACPPLERPGTQANDPIAPGELRLDGVRVLVVDDHADARHLLRTLIEQRGGHVTEADSAAAALALLAHGRPDVLIADLAMPDVDGFDLFASVRQLHPHLPGIALTAHARPRTATGSFRPAFRRTLPSRSPPTRWWRGCATSRRHPTSAACRSPLHEAGLVRLEDKGLLRCN